MQKNLFFGENMKYICCLWMFAGLCFMSCSATTGNMALANLDDQQLPSKIIKGETTAEEVISFLGNPSDVDFDNRGIKKLTYTYSKRADKLVNYVPYVNMLHNGTYDTDKKIVILLNDNDVVTDYVITQSQGQTSRGLLRN